MYLATKLVARCMKISLYFAISLVARYMEISIYLVMCFIARYTEISMYLAAKLVHVPCNEMCGKMHENFLVPCHNSMYLVMCFIARYTEISMYLAAKLVARYKITSITDKFANRFQTWLNLRYSSC